MSAYDVKNGKTPPFYYPRADESCTPTDYIGHKDVWYGFTATASTHGIAHIHYSKGIFKRIFLTLSFLTCAALLGYQMYLITNYYLNNPVSPVVVKQNARILDFPAVSVCNTNPIKSSQLHLSNRLQALIDSWQKSKRKRRSLRNNEDSGPAGENTDDNLFDNVNKYKKSITNQTSVVKSRIKRAAGNALGNFSITYQSLNQSGAQAHCAASCATCRLADLDSSAEEQRALDQHKCDGFVDTWIGIKNVGGTYQWIHNNRVAWSGGAWGHWATADGEPNEGVGMCARIRYSDGRTADRSCSSVYPAYFCEGDFVNPCDPNPCYNGGTCCVVDMDFKCVCPPGLTDSQCYTPTTTEATTTTTEPATTTPKTTSVYPDREPYREDFLQETELMETIADIPVDLKKEMGYQLNDLILSCQYDNEACDLSNFGEFFDAIHGNCYVFNSGWTANSASLPARRPGRSSGLKMTFNIGQEEYINGLSKAAGIVVVVHPKTRMPFPEDEGVFATPGYLTSVGLNQVSVSRLGGKYSDCIEETYNPAINVFEDYHKVNYSISACLKTCYQKNVMEKCNCADPQYPTSGQAFGSMNTPVCSVRDQTQDDCVYGVLLEYIADNLTCDCPTPCTETTYKYSPTRGEWPSEKYYDRFVQENAVSLGGVLNVSTNASYVRRNLVNIEVYFNEFNYQYIYEKPTYPITLYLADVASILGLWLGMSLFSVSEFLELAVDLIVVSCCRIRKRKNKRPSSRSSSTSSGDGSSIREAFTDSNTARRSSLVVVSMNGNHIRNSRRLSVATNDSNTNSKRHSRYGHRHRGRKLGTTIQPRIEDLEETDSSYINNTSYTNHNNNRNKRKQQNDLFSDISTSYEPKNISNRNRQLNIQNNDRWDFDI